MLGSVGCEVSALLVGRSSLFLAVMACKMGNKLWRIFWIVDMNREVSNEYSTIGLVKMVANDVQSISQLVLNMGLNV